MTKFTAPLWFLPHGIYIMELLDWTVFQVVKRKKMLHIEALHLYLEAF